MLAKYKVSNDVPPTIVGALSAPQLKSINKSSNSCVSKNSLVKEKGVFWNILCMQYLILINGLKACSKEVNSGMFMLALELPPVPPIIN